MNTLLIPRKLQAIQTGARPGLLLPALLRHAGCAALFFLASALNGGAQTTLVSVNDENYTGYVLDSDALYGRSNVQAHAVFNLYNNTGHDVSMTSVLCFRLMNVSGSTPTPHPIYDYGNADTNQFYTYNITNVTSVPSGLTPITVEKHATIRPAAWMSQFTNFVVECTLTNNGVEIATLNTTPARNYYHFTNTFSGDDAYNVLLNLTAGFWSRTYAVSNVAGQNTFWVNADYEIRRWDGFNGSVVSDEIPILFDYVLKDKNGNAVSLVTNRQVVSPSVPSHASGSPPVPFLVSQAQTLYIQPAVQLDSVYETYYLTVTISHTNNPISGQVLTANIQQTLTTQLLHFNGDLVFGPIHTTITSLGVPLPPLHTQVSGVVPTTLSSVGGGLTAYPHDTYTALSLGVNLDMGGTATVTSGTASLITNYDSTAQVRFQRRNGSLTTSGATSDIFVTLPTGFGYRLNDINSPVVQSTIPFSGQTLTANLQPVATQLTYSGTIYAAEESKPVWLPASSIVWHVDSGIFEVPKAETGAIYVRAAQYVSLQSVSNLLVDPPAMGDKRSNDKYWQALTGADLGTIVKPDASGNALLTATFNFGSGSFQTHFPYDILLAWSTGGTMQVTNDAVQAGALQNASTVSVSYSQNCPGGCTGGVASATVTMTPLDSKLNFTLDGGLVATGSTVSPINLQWGYIASSSAYAQQALAFTEAAFHMPGVFLRGDENLLLPVQGPTTILYTGFGAAGPSLIDRPLSAAYLAGLADYAGLNFRCVADHVHQASSTIAGTPGINWWLTGPSKYYVRFAGVSGIHQAVSSTFPQNLTLWGYPFTFNSYGVSYLDSQNKDSVTDGTIDFGPTTPAGFSQNFASLRFSCLGALVSADVPDGDGFKQMAYWLADFKTHSIRFATPSNCDPSTGYLVLGIEGYASHLDKALYGEVGFFSSGDQIPASFGLSGVTSRLKVPNVVHFDGPTNSTYTLTPVQDAYYNTWTNKPPDNIPPDNIPGWINIFGKLDIPFFEDMQVHLQTGCHINGSTDVGSIYLSGGWPRPGSQHATEHGWEEFGHTPFEPSLFDTNNTGWDIASKDIASYRDNASGEQYHPRAQRLWLNVVPFDYPLSWDTTLRVFASWQEITNDLLVVNIQHQIKYMDPINAEIDFGAQYDGLPQISIANLAFDAVDKATGMSASIVKAAGKPVEDALTSGLDKMDELLDTQMKRLMDDVFDKTVNPIIDQFYVKLSNDWTTVTSDVNQRQQFIGVVETNALNFFVGNPAYTNLTAALTHMGDAADQANNLLGKIQKDLQDATNAIEAVIGDVTIFTNGTFDPGTAITGLVAKAAGGNRAVVPALLQDVVGNLAPVFIDSVVGPALTSVVEKLDPALEQITSKLKETEGLITNVYARLGTLGEFTAEITNTLQQCQGELANVSTNVSLAITQFFGQFNYTVDNPFTDVSADDVKKFIRQKVEDEFFATTAASRIQTELRQRLYDVDAAMKQEIDSVFQQLDGALRDLISESLAKVDQSINKCLGEVRDVIGAGQLNGHALINGDSLKELRIDGDFQFKVPDDMELKAFLEIKEMASDGSDGGCFTGGGRFTEVTLGAEKIPVHWLSPDLEADLEAKFTLNTNGWIVNLGGQIDLLGELKFEAFTLHDLAVALAFGKFENYLALKGGLKFNEYDFSGALFVGKTCSLDPIKLIDPDVAGVLGIPPFTGGYCYGQGWLPVSEMILGVPPSCMFDISAGVGAGAFYFLQGPTYGGKIFLGVSGELLCMVDIEGVITMIGVKHGGDLSYSGHGHFEAELGSCPFCLKFAKDLNITYVNKAFHLQ